jgi:hypothetical protein
MIDTETRGALLRLSTAAALAAAMLAAVLYASPSQAQNTLCTSETRGGTTTTACETLWPVPGLEDTRLS